jgi:ribosomal protein S18 acetylase RimI-like enzyme
MVGELLSEIMNAIGVRAFNFDLEETTDRLKDVLDREKYFVFVAREEGGNAVGFVALYESHSLYAEGAFGTIPELYVFPGYRSNHVGLRLVSQAKAFGAARGWKSQHLLCRSLIRPWPFTSAKVLLSLVAAN